MILYDSMTQENIRPKIIIMGVGGAGGNMINAIVEKNIPHIYTIALNTDAQALLNINANEKIQLGSSIVHGMGTGANPEIGKVSAEEDFDAIANAINDADIVFLLGGLGGGTGSGAIPVIARYLQEKNILTISVITKPFFFEGSRRNSVAQQALQKIEEFADTVITIPNQKLFEAHHLQDISLLDAFNKVNSVIVDCILAVSETIYNPGLINVDFADIKTTMTRMGRAIIGIGCGKGEKRASEAIQSALSSPLLESTSLKGARSILLNIRGDNSLSLHEMNVIASFVHDEVHPEAHIILGSTIQNNNNDDSLSLTLIATGFEDQAKSRINHRIPNYSGYNKSPLQKTFSSHAPQIQQDNQYFTQTEGVNNSFFQQKNSIENQKNPYMVNQQNIDIPTFLRNQGSDKTNPFNEK